MASRRLHVSNLRIGTIELAKSDAHHARDVLRLTVGAIVELFDDAGNRADATIENIDRDSVFVRVGRLDRDAGPTGITIASAIPKGERADWMIEKLSELGVSRFVPLITRRSIVQASGKNKLDRWKRIATESAKQSRRSGVMRIDAPMPLAAALHALKSPAYLSTTPDATPIAEIKVADVSSLFTGPEGGWSDEEIALFGQHAMRPLKLTATILRTETAAVAAAAIVAALSQVSAERG